jgi:hypothetical protein
MPSTITKLGLDPLTSPEEGANASLVIVWTGSGDDKRIDYIEKTVGGVTWRKTFSYDGSYDITGVSVWVRQ